MKTKKHKHHDLSPELIKTLDASMEKHRNPKVAHPYPRKTRKLKRDNNGQWWDLYDKVCKPNTQILDNLEGIPKFDNSNMEKTFKFIQPVIEFTKLHLVIDAIDLAIEYEMAALHER